MPAGIGYGPRKRVAGTGKGRRNVPPGHPQQAVDPVWKKRRRRPLHATGGVQASGSTMRALGR